MVHGAAVEIKFEKMQASTYETKFWEALGGYSEDVDLDLQKIDAIETARKNGHGPAKLAQIIKDNTN